MVRKYRTLFILPATLKEDELDQTLKRVEETIAQQGGVTSDVNLLGKRAFARPTKNLDAGYYVRMTVDLEPDNVDVLRSRLKRDEGVFRVQILREDEKARPEAAAEEKAAAVAEESDNG